ncbi:MAG: hypothetical protein ACYCSO_04650 [Cuniculiplasma sp.]
MQSFPISVPKFTLTEFFLQLEVKPYIVFIFLVPVLMIFFYFIILKINTHRRKVDSEPTLKQEKEDFKIPEDYINTEMLFVQNRDYDHFETNLENSSKKITILSKDLNRKARKYRRMKYRITYTASERKKQKLSKAMQEQFKEVMQIYASIQKVTIDLDLKKIEEE